MLNDQNIQKKLNSTTIRHSQHLKVSIDAVVRLCCFVVVFVLFLPSPTLI